MKKLTVELDRATYKALVRLAKHRGEIMEEMVAEAVAAMLRNA